jgi:DNA protecting protein DprA
MKIDQKILLLTHVASQLLGRWFPAPSIFSYKLCNLGLLDQSTYRDLIECDMGADDPYFGWLWSYVEQGRLTVAKLLDAVERHVDLVLRDDGNMIFIDSPYYPESLRFIARPPLVLSVLGQVDLLLNRCVGVIGSRRASYESLRASAEVGQKLSELGFSVVSGGAIGCDIASHEGVLQNSSDARAVVVFAGGLSSRFPRCNERTFNELLERGGLFVSERLWFQQVLPHDFIARNRLLSGLSEAVVVMGASIKSGTMVTAREALEQGRDVYVFSPSDVPDVRMDGSVSLSQDGAQVFKSADELLGFLNAGLHDVPILLGSLQEGGFNKFYGGDLPLVGGPW